MIDKGNINELAELVPITSLRNLVSDFKVTKGELFLNVKADSLVKTITFLKDDVNFQFEQLIDICGVDYLNREPRFDVVYHLLSISLNQRICVVVQVADKTPIPSAVSVYETAEWYEREVWDMYGISFFGNPDMCKILTESSFNDYPLRKDYPLNGSVKWSYDEKEQRLTAKSVDGII
ncbi:MAG: NADH-quinone oxidoreductase subunit C [Alphaproteobacteria bacterium]|nr:NADH-quinone oxidoreductase subunit C [Alphaproteobacteria bacterium]